MNLYVLVNDIRAVDADSTTARLAVAGESLFDAVHIVDVAGFEVTSSQRVMIRIGSDDTPHLLDDGASVLVRTSPGRDLNRWREHATAMSLLQTARESGTRVENSPMGLHTASSKLYLHRLDPKVVTPSFITADAGALLRYIDRADNRVVLKPLRGSMGRDVFFVDRHHRANTAGIITHLCESGYVIAQPFLPEVELGDLRILTLDGEVLTVGGQQAAVRRVPPAGELRANVHAGARAEPVMLSEEVVANAEIIAQELLRDGIRFAGLDFIGARLIEANVYSPGGLTDVDVFYGEDFTRKTLRQLFGRS